MHCKQLPRSKLMCGKLNSLRMCALSTWFVWTFMGIDQIMIECLKVHCPERIVIKIKVSECNAYANQSCTLNDCKWEMSSIPVISKNKTFIQSRFSETVTYGQHSSSEWCVKFSEKKNWILGRLINQYIYHAITIPLHWTNIKKFYSSNIILITK